jgi:DIM1 family U5 snRNP protein
MSYLLPHLRSGWHVDQAILTEEERVVVLRFGRDADETCMRMDEVRRRIFSRRRAHRSPSDPPEPA